MDVYSVPTMGGDPSRLTYHGMNDRILDWYPDGKQVLFASSIKSGRQRFSQLYLVAAHGGLPEMLPIPFGEFAAFSPDGKHRVHAPVAGVPHVEALSRRLGARHLSLRRVDQKVENLTKDANDELPMWPGRSSISCPIAAKSCAPTSGPTTWAKQFNRSRISTTSISLPRHRAGPHRVRSGRPPLSAQPRARRHRSEIQVVTDATTLLPRTNAPSSSKPRPRPDGKRAVFKARGDVFSVPAEHGPVLNLTSTSGSAERYPRWSPDGKSLAYWSDARANTSWCATCRRQREKLTSHGPGYRYPLLWSPDSKDRVHRSHHAHPDADVSNGKPTEIDQEPTTSKTSLEGLPLSWSPDSRWLWRVPQGGGKHGDRALRHEGREVAPGDVGLL